MIGRSARDSRKMKAANAAADADLIEESGGALSLESHEGAGTSFVARLPRYDHDDFLTQGEQPTE